MKALSFLQPWGWAVLHGGKRIDNRIRKDGRMTYVCRHRGQMLIHVSAGKGPRVHGIDSDGNPTSSTYVDWAAAWMREQWQLKASCPIPPNDVPRGGIIGCCIVVAHVDPDGDVFSHIGDACPQRWPALDMRWHMTGSYGLVLADVEPLPFIPWRGALGLFEVPDVELNEHLRIARGVRTRRGIITP